MGRSLPSADTIVPKPSFSEALTVWAKIGVLSFGGPAGQIALMHRELVETRRWIGEERYLHALNFCMLLPGPEAMQLATYVGWMLHGTAGGLAAGILFVLPGALIVLALSIAYALFGHGPLVVAAFTGIKAAVLVIVIEALLRVARRALRKPRDWMIAAAAFIAIFVFAVPFPLVIIAAALAGYLLAGTSPATAPPRRDAVTVPVAQTIRTVSIWLAIWLLPLFAVALAFSRDHVLSQISVLFSKLAVVTFGGAYAALAYMAQQAVETYGWLSAGEMLDGLGLAETTPGPLVLVMEFVGFLAGYRFGGEPQMLFGLLGALVTLWATFVPCFLWIFAGAPYIERLENSPRLAGALSAVTAAVVGVILNLSLWFALHVLFGRIDAVWYGPLRLWLPDFATLNVEAALLSLVSAVLLLRLHIGIAATLAVSGTVALLWSLFA